MRSLLLFCSIVVLSLPGLAQDVDLLSLLEEEPTTDYVYASFKANRIINLHSIENTHHRVLDIKISHRFGAVTGGFDQFYGLDQATIRIGGDYGITDWLQIGAGRSSYLKIYDGYLKGRILRQSSGARNMPISASAVASIDMRTADFADPTRENFFSSRLAYTYQLLIARKFSDGFSMQISPTMVHRNLVMTKAEKNDVFAVSSGARLKLSKRLSLNGEYTYVLPDQLAERFRNTAAIGLDIETGGHVFQLHFSNTTSMTDKGIVTDTRDSWETGDIHFGFNISRVFTIKKRKPSEKVG